MRRRLTGARRPDRPGLPRPTVKGGEVATNRALGRLRHLFGWAIRKGHTEQTPFKRHGQTVISLESKVERPRRRRLEPGEEEGLLHHAQAHLRALIVAMLETGCRPGELLTLTWGQVRWGESVLCFYDDITKNAFARTILSPKGSVRSWRCAAPTPRASHSRRARTSSATRSGERVKSVQKAWDEDVWAGRGSVGLHLHDLRREFASQLQEAPGVSPHEVATWLGHSNISTTSRYLSTTTAGHLHHTLKKLGKARQSRTNVAQTPPTDDTADSDESQNPAASY